MSVLNVVQFSYLAKPSLILVHIRCLSCLSSYCAQVYFDVFKRPSVRFFGPCECSSPLSSVYLLSYLSFLGIYMFVLFFLLCNTSRVRNTENVF